MVERTYREGNVVYARNYQSETKVVEWEDSECFRDTDLYIVELEIEMSLKSM